MRAILLGLLLVQPLFAATPYKKSLAVKKDSYLSDGVFVGGRAGDGTSLLSVRRVYSPKKQLERVILDLGDGEAKPSGGRVGYFQVAMDRQTNRLVVDLSQLRYSKVTEGQLRALFKKSPFVKSVAMTLDPEDKTATMVLNLKMPAKLEVFKKMQKNKPARVVMDLVPIKNKTKAKQ